MKTTKTCTRLRTPRSILCRCCDHNLKVRVHLDTLADVLAPPAVEREHPAVLTATDLHALGVR